MSIEIIKVEVINDEWIKKHFPSIDKKKDENLNPNRRTD